MTRSYNSLGNLKLDDLKLGLCPVCNRRLAAECEHRTLESETWYAAHIIAELEIHNENNAASTIDAARPPADHDDADILRAARTVSPNAVLVENVRSGSDWQQKAEADAADYADLLATQESARF